MAVSTAVSTSTAPVVPVQPELEAPLVGMGASADDCGYWFPAEFCDGAHAHVHLARHQCGRKECPRCWSGRWAAPRTVSVVQRLSAARWAEADGLDRRQVHASINPPEGEISTVEETMAARSRAVELAKEHGVRGGVMIVHFYRATEETKTRFRAAKEAGEEAASAGIWRFIRENGRPWIEQVIWSPHFHVVGLCRDFKPGDSDVDGGWVCKNHSTGRRRFSPMESLNREAPYEETIGTVRYLLSHTSKVGNRQTVTWYGSIHGTNFKPEDELSDGAWATIQRRVEELVGAVDDRPEEAEDGEDRPCPVEGCEGRLHPIWQVPDYIEQRGDDLELEALVRLRTAYDWARGVDDDSAPPGGWPRVETESEAVELLQELSGVDGHPCPERLPQGADSFQGMLPDRPESGWE